MGKSDAFLRWFLTVKRYKWLLPYFYSFLERTVKFCAETYFSLSFFLIRAEFEQVLSGFPETCGKLQQS